MNESIIINILKILIIISFVIWILKTFKIVVFYLIGIKKWKQTNGIILESNIEWFRSKSDSDTEGWEEKIIYKYNVDSQDYENDCISKNLGFLVPFKKWVNNHNYEKNQEVLIYYNPKNPKDSIIDKNLNIFSILLPLLFFVFIFTVIYPNI